MNNSIPPFILPKPLEDIIFANITTRSSHDETEMTERVKKPVLKLLRNYLAANNPSIFSRPLLYVGSDTDVESALYLGFTDIILMDPMFINSDRILTALKKTERYVDTLMGVESNEEMSEFEGILSYAHTPLRLRFIPKIFQDRQLSQEYHGLPMYQITGDENIGLIFSFMLYGAEWLENPSFWKAIAPGGYIYCPHIPVSRKGEWGVMLMLSQIAPGLLYEYLRDVWKGRQKKAVKIGNPSFDGLLVQNAKP